jgi:hypothetical protein
MANLTMSTPPANAFIPPTAGQLQAHLERHPPRLASRWHAWLPVVFLTTFGALVLGWMLPGLGLLMDAVFLVGLVALLCLSTMLSARARRIGALERQVTAAQELAALRRHAESLRLAWRVLPAVTAVPELHWRTVACMAQVLDQLGAHEAALTGFDYLAERTSAEQPVGAQVRIQRAVLLLLLDRMIDADDALRSLRGPVEATGDPVVRAAYRLAGLQQQVHTHHYDDAVAGAASLLEDLRPLGIEAGYGHALMALSFYASSGATAAAPAATPAQPAAPAQAHAQARLWWSRATLLLPVALLVRRCAALSDLARDPALAAATARPTPPGTR